ncbi:hypothetical protein N7488_007686 [Penicillium malachiteum]|nr:hypothetical protein N7488_007686 [Penicillium malachiteum]
MWDMVWTTAKNMCVRVLINFARAGVMKLLAMELMRFDIFSVNPNAPLISELNTYGTLREPARSYDIRVKPKQDVDKSTLRPVQPENLSTTTSMENPCKEHHDCVACEFWGNS